MSFSSTVLVLLTLYSQERGTEWLKRDQVSHMLVCYFSQHSHVSDKHQLEVGGGSLISSQKGREGSNGNERLSRLWEHEPACSHVDISRSRGETGSEAGL